MRRAKEYSLCLVLILGTTASFAQTLRDPSPSSWGVGYFGVGSPLTGGEVETVFAIGAAYEGRLAGPVGVGVGVSWLSGFSGPGDGFGSFEPGILFSFEGRGKSVPFVQAGFDLYFRSGTASGLYLGGGLDHWWKESLGLRVELRDHMVFWDGVTDHLLMVRLGAVFR